MQKKKRILVMISPELEAALTEMVVLTGGSKASICGEMLEQSLPVLQQMNVALNAAVSGQVEALDLLNNALATAAEASKKAGRQVSATQSKVRRWAPNKHKSPDA